MREKEREMLRQPQRVRRLWPGARLTLRTAAAKDEGSREERRLAKAFASFLLKEYTSLLVFVANASFNARVSKLKQRR